MEPNLNDFRKASGLETLSATGCWTKRFWLLFAGVLALRVVFVALMPADLAGDESYYWDWGRQLSWGYFSKPPFIAWLMAWAGWAGGDTVFGVRVWAAILGSGSMVAVFLLGRRMYGEKSGFLAAALFAAMPGAAMFSLLMTVDSPLMFFWCTALCAFHGSLHARSNSGRTVSLLVLLVALGTGHLTKQMMWTFPLLAVIYLVFDGKEGRAKLRSPALLAVLGGSYLSLVPTLLWNSANGWITYKHTEHHFQGNGLAEFPGNLAEFLVMQLGAISPVTVTLLFGLVLPGVWCWRRLASRERLLVTFSGIPLTVMLLMLLRQGLNGNWGAAFYPAGLVLVAGWANPASDIRGMWLREKTRSWVVPGLWVGVALSAVVYALPFAIEATGKTGAKIDLLARLRGWAEYAKRVDEVRQTLPEKNLPILVVGHRYNVSALAFYLPDRPRVYHWAPPGKIKSQYQLWGGLDELKGRQMLVVFCAENEKPLPQKVDGLFSGSHQVGTVEVLVGNGRKMNFQLHQGRFEGLPETADKKGGDQ